MTYPLIFQEAWVLESIKGTVIPHFTYLQPLIDKKFVNQGKTVAAKTPICRIYKFLKTTEDGGITAIVNDSSHKVLVKFNYDCVRRYEQKYQRRITYLTSHSHILVRQCKLLFLKTLDLIEQYGLRMKGTMVVLEILEVERFQTSQLPLDAMAENALSFIYHDRNYQDCFTGGYTDIDEINELMRDDYDDMRSL